MFLFIYFKAVRCYEAVQHTLWVEQVRGGWSALRPERKRTTSVRSSDSGNQPTPSTQWPMQWAVVARPAGDSFQRRREFFTDIGNFPFCRKYIRWGWDSSRISSLPSCLPPVHLSRLLVVWGGLSITYYSSDQEGSSCAVPRSTSYLLYQQGLSCAIIPPPWPAGF